LTAVVSSVTVTIDARAEQTDDADHLELLERGTAMFDGLSAVLKQKT
jgi:hypothetical protein